MNQKIKVRIAPSPTGSLHVGTARTALFNFLFARHHGGKFLVRIEDTDVERSNKEFEKDILEGLEWLGIVSDEVMVRQSDRLDIYKKYVKQLVDKNLASEVDGAVILKNSKTEIIFTDLVRGKIKFEDVPNELVILKSDGTPTYNFAVVVDDYEMGITHVIRGEDHISNTPRQILVIEALGFSRPQYIHIPMILASDRSKLSKRHGAVSLLEYRKKGYLAQAMLNYLALLGWNPGTEQEIFTLDELIKQFDIAKIQKSGAIFDEKKLDWVNKEHIKHLLPEEQKKILLKSIENEPYMRSEPELDVGKIGWKDTNKGETLRHLETVRELIQKNATLKNATLGVAEIMVYAEKEGKGNVLWPVRYALTGLDASPDPFTILEILGKEKSLKRLEKAIMALRK